MVKIKRATHYNDDGQVDVEKWLTHFSQKRSAKEVSFLRHALHLAQVASGDHLTSEGQSCFQQGVIMAEILFELNLDVETLVTALLYNTVRNADLRLEDISEQVSKGVSNLLAGVLQMEGVNLWHKHHEIHIENLRKMLLVMVQDVRGVFIKLAERLCVLRYASTLNKVEQQKIAHEVMDIYSPLANRLGLGQLKWELEDLSFRYLEPQTYKKLAKLLDARRLDRENYIQDVISVIDKTLKKEGVVHFQISGRAKHIYSIYRKMKRKSVGYEEIYDVSAVRVLVDTVEQCYQVLSVVHHLWEPIAKEFDDYIAHPKANGYASLHTAVLGPQKRNVEVQIRTIEMHNVSELGVAAHWMYKEGATRRSDYEEKIAWLRQVLDWQRELVETENISAEAQKKLFNDRVYVFTPKGDIIDLPVGATPVDLAYHIHSDVGHRCRGAKINGVMVPLTHVLGTGERVDILTAKESHPSRDWLNPQSGYIKTARARAKLHHWFRQLDFERHSQEGAAVLEKELKRLGIQSINPEEIAHQLHFKSRQDMLAALGNGDIRLSQITHLIEKPKSMPEAFVVLKPSRKVTSKAAFIEGAENFLTYTAKCCKPVPGEPIVGFITKTRGVAIHRKDCMNVLQSENLEEDVRARFIDVKWYENEKVSYPVDLYVVAHDRHGLLRDITSVLALEKISLLGVQTKLGRDNLAYITLTVSVSGLSLLNKVLDKIQYLSGMVSVTRQVK